jgi:hypothetical protein
MSLNSRQHFQIHPDHRCNIDLQRDLLRLLAWGQVAVEVPPVRARGQAQAQAAEAGPLTRRVAGEGKNLVVGTLTCLGRQDLRLFRRTCKIWPRL